MPELLRSHGADSPAEIDYCVGSVSHRLKRPHGKLSRSRSPSHHFPAGNSGLLLHNPEILLLKTPDHIERRGSHISPFMGSVGEKSTRILIVADKVQLFSQIIIVHLIGKSHIIVGDKMIRAVSADYLRLFLHKIHNQVGTEAFPVQHRRWILTCHRNLRSKNL